MDYCFDELWKRYTDVREELNALLPTEGPAAEDPTIKELERARLVLSWAVLGHPDSFKKVRCWMIDVKGRMSECDISPEMVRNVQNDAVQNRGHKYVEQFGALPSEVRNVMVMWNLTDSGGGCGCWHLGCHCTEEEAHELCCELYQRFGYAIEKGLLIVERKFWSLRLK
jgi:hypothetical protein